jgi:hypothetical protein
VIVEYDSEGRSVAETWGHVGPVDDAATVDSSSADEGNKRPPGPLPRGPVDLDDRYAGDWIKGRGRPSLTSQRRAHSAKVGGITVSGPLCRS